MSEDGYVMLPVEADARFARTLATETDAEKLWRLARGCENHGNAPEEQTRERFPEHQEYKV